MCSCRSLNVENCTVHTEHRNSSVSNLNGRIWLFTSVYTVLLCSSFKCFISSSNVRRFMLQRAQASAVISSLTICSSILLAMTLISLSLLCSCRECFLRSAGSANCSAQNAQLYPCDSFDLTADAFECNNIFLKFVLFLTDSGTTLECDLISFLVFCVTSFKSSFDGLSILITPDSLLEPINRNNIIETLSESSEV